MTSTSQNKNMSFTKTTPQVEDAAVQVEKNKSFPVLDLNVSTKKLKEINKENLATTTKVSTGVIVSQSADPRTRAFDMISNKTNVGKTLVCTKACKAVTDFSTNEGEFGVCYRENCTFAHSLEELQAPACQFDNNCRFKNGRYDNKTWEYIPNTECKFRHTSETVPEWMKRAHISPPKLPETNKLSRKPIVKSVVKPVVKPVVKSVVKSVVKPEIRTKVEQQPKISRWDQKLGSSEQAKSDSEKSESSSDSEKSESSSDSEKSESSSESESESSSESESESESESPPIRRTVSRKRSTTPKTFNTSVMNIIRVPTKELAEMAIKAAFDKGVFNIQIIIG